MIHVIWVVTPSKSSPLYTVEQNISVPAKIIWVSLSKTKFPFNMAPGHHLHIISILGAHVLQLIVKIFGGADHDYLQNLVN